ncbi:DNA-binding response regulator, partial [Enterococcus faecium]
MERIVKNYLMMVDLDARLELSTDLPNDILKWRTQEQHDYLFLLDIELNHEMNGIILASQLRESYPHAKIVFITSHTEMAFLS